MRQVRIAVPTSEIYRCKILLVWGRPFLHPLPLTIIREICGFLAVPFPIPTIRGNYVRIYDPRNGVVKSGFMQWNFTKGAVFCPYDYHSVLGIGGEPPATDAISIDLRSFAVEKKADMSEKRSFPGAIHCYQFVYLFGGAVERNPGELHPLATCEKYILSEDCWIPLPSMSVAKWGVAPCCYQKEIYVPGGAEGGKSIEVLDTAAEIFEILCVRLDEFDGCLVSFVVGTNLCIVSNNGMIGKIELAGRNRTSVNVVLGKITRNVAFCNCAVKVIARKAYWMDYQKGTLVEFNVDMSQIAIIQ